MQNQIDNRQKVNVVLRKDENGTRVLFVNHPLSGELGLTWFPIQSELTAFQAIEQIMVLAGVAHNVVSVDEVCQVWEEPKEHGRKYLEVVYNTPVEHEYTVIVRNNNIDHLVEDYPLVSFKIKSANIIETLLKMNYTEQLSEGSYNLVQYYKKVAYDAYQNDIYIGDGEKEYMLVEWHL